MLKEFAKGEGFDVLALECLTSPPTRKRRQKKKLPGGEISTPALPTPRSISDEKQALVASGKLSIGEPCSPYLLTKYIVTNDGEVKTNQIELHGRKIPLYELRQKLLIQQENYMKLMTDNEIKSLSKEEILKEMSGVHHKPNQDSTTEDLRLQLASLQPLSQRSNCCRSRKYIRWHIPVHAIFAVFYLFFFPVLSRPSFTSRTPNKDQKTEQLFYFQFVQVP